MTALYTIALDYRDAAETLADLDLPPEVVADTLESMAGDLEVKVQSVAFCLRNMESTARAIKDAESEMAKRRNAIEGRVQHLKTYLLGAMQLTGVLKVAGPYLTISVRDNPEAVDILDVCQLPVEFMVVPPRPPAYPDKVAIKAAIKAGDDVPGAKLTRSQRLDISA